jgi:hypothetical protein
MINWIKKKIKLWVAETLADVKTNIVYERDDILILSRRHGDYVFRTLNDLGITTLPSNHPDPGVIHIKDYLNTYR